VTIIWLGEVSEIDRKAMRHTRHTNHCQGTYTALKIHSA